MIVCSACNAENAPGHKFCSNCGSTLALTCPSCGTENEAGHRFCFNCGGDLGDAAPVTSSTALAASVQPASSAEPSRTERRFVSVLFADLVSFTTFSEHRDSEEVRAMLTVYFERSKEIIGRYGGEIDKFIGDAVMGVWGAVESHEDDAERATRAALDLVSMVSELGAEIGVDELALRAGVLSGETAVGPGGNEKGLVVGDLVNTASRLQSIAPPGGVFVGAPTRDLIAANIETRPAGEHLVKGKDVPVAAFEALRVVSDPSKRAAHELLEGPFVGRDDELRLLKDQLHATGREGRARLVSIVGEGGIGKTRLAQELSRYIDGIVELIYSHHGRSPSYGDGVTFWALGEMVRQRAGIAESDDPVKARMRLRTMVTEYVPNEEDQKWIEPRLAGLIGLADMPSGDRSEMFAALRSFFQNVAAMGTVLMVFEDMHWADDGLVDFVDELVERTTKHPILVVTLSRPDLLDRRPDWGSSRKRMVSMHLSRLEDEPMRELVAGLAPGLPEGMVERIASRTAGVPLHAVEFIRMLVNSGQLVREADTYRFDGVDADLAVPDSLSAIIGARLDRLDDAELALVQDATVLGYSFTLDSLATMLGRRAESLTELLGDLVRREVFEFEEDPRSPERGQYRFVQSLIQEVAYARLTNTEKVSRHLEVAVQLARSNDPELAGVIASHLASASKADPADTDLSTRAGEALIGAAERATELHSHAQALRLYDQAIAHAGDGAEARRLLVISSRSAYVSGAPDSLDRAQRALDGYRADGDEVGVVVATTAIAFQLSGEFRAAEAGRVILPVYESTPKDGTIQWARLASETARALMLDNRPDEAIVVADVVLPVVAELGDDELLLETMVNRGTALCSGGRSTEGLVSLLGVADYAKSRAMIEPQIRAMNNYYASLQFDDARSLPSADVNDLIEKSGNHSWMVRWHFFNALALTSHGRYTEAIAMLDQSVVRESDEFWFDWVEIARLATLLVRDGDTTERAPQFEALLAKYATTDDVQLRENVMGFLAGLHFWLGEFGRVLELADDTGPIPVGYPAHWEFGVAAAALVGDSESISTYRDRIDQMDGGRVVKGLSAFAATYASAVEGDLANAAIHYRVADDLWSEAGAPDAHAIARAVVARLVGTGTPLGEEAAKASFEFFIGAGSTLFLELFADIFDGLRFEVEKDVAI
jgi:class 3 adenylate cyclase/tetratricopeptide (TPR) repeat protein